MRRLAIQPAEQPKAGARIARRIASKHVDYPAQSPRAVQGRTSPFDHLHALNLLQGHGIPLDVAHIRRQHWKSIHQHQQPTARAATVAARSAHDGLATYLADARDIAQGACQREGIVIGDALGIGY